MLKKIRSLAVYNTCNPKPFYKTSTTHIQKYIFKSIQENQNNILKLNYKYFIVVLVKLEHNQIQFLKQVAKMHQSNEAQPIVSRQKDN